MSIHTAAQIKQAFDRAGLRAPSATDLERAARACGRDVTQTRATAPAPATAP